jgi:flagellar hook-associated protein 3 FlgL
MSGTLNSIYNNATFALHLHTEDLVRLQEQAATGSRINRPSDDPSAGYRVLRLDSQVRSLENYIDNLSEVTSTLEISLTVVEDMISIFTGVRTTLTQITSDIYDEEGRQRTAEQIDDMLEQMVVLANSERMDQHLFGGCNTGAAPYLVERTDGRITRVTYQGSTDVRNIEVAPGVQASAFNVGDNVFSLNNRSAPIFLDGNTGVAAGTGTSSVDGYVWLEITEPVAGTYRLSIDGGNSYVDVAVPPGSTNTMVTHADTGEVLYVDTTGISSTGVELVSNPGTYDIFNTLITARDMLQNERGLSDAQLQELEEDLMKAVNDVNDLLVQSSVSIGTKIGFLDDLKNSLTVIKYNAEDNVTRLQEADITQVAIDISRREILYQMSLAVAAELMSLSLLDFIK